MKTWVHGLNLQVEYPQGVEVERKGWGTSVRQHRGGNWFHLVLPTITQTHHDEPVFLLGVQVRAHVGEHARILRVHVRDGEKLILDKPAAVISSGWFDFYFEVGRVQVEYGIAVCVQAHFDDASPRGSILFEGVGGVFAV